MEKNKRTNLLKIDQVLKSQLSLVGSLGLSKHLLISCLDSVNTGSQVGPTSSASRHYDGGGQDSVQNGDHS